MLDPCWHHFSLLGASWAHFVLLVAFVVVFGWFLCVLGRSCSILEASERVRGGFWRPQGFIFRGFWAHACMQCEKSPTGVLYGQNQYETHVGHSAHDAKNEQNSTRTPVEQRFPPRSCYKLVLEGPGLGFGGVWVPRGRLLRALDRLLASLGRLLAPLGSFLGTSWTSLGRSWAHVGC